MSPKLKLLVPTDSRAVETRKAIRKYLALPDAAQLVSRLSPTTSITEAGEQWHCADAESNRLREELAKSMDDATLLELEKTLLEGDPHLRGGNIESASHVSHPVIGPVARERLYRDELFGGTADQRRLAHDALWKTVAANRGDPPSLPCSLQVALRFVLGDAESPWPVIARAFQGFLDYRHFRSESLDSTWRKEMRRIAFAMDHPHEARRAYGEAGISLTAFQLQLIREAEEIQSQIAFASDFSPHQPVPVTEGSRPDSIRRWDWEGGVDELEDIVLWLQEFTGFWKKYGAKYAQIQTFEDGQRQEADQKTKARTTGYSRGGAMASRVRVHPHLVALTKAYLESLKGGKITIDSMKAFPMEAFKDRVEAKRGRTFLTTLWTARSPKNTPNDLVELLAEEKIKVLRATAYKCRKLLLKAEKESTGTI